MHLLPYHVVYNFPEARESRVPSVSYCTVIEARGGKKERLGFPQTVEQWSWASNSIPRELKLFDSDGSAIRAAHPPAAFSLRYISF
jgi:hypothetical protein